MEKIFNPNNQKEEDPAGEVWKLRAKITKLKALNHHLIKQNFLQSVHIDQQKKNFIAYTGGVQGDFILDVPDEIRKDNLLQFEQFKNKKLKEVEDWYNIIPRGKKRHRKYSWKSSKRSAIL